MKLEELLNYVQPTEYIVTTENYSDRFETPVLTAGKTFVLGKTNEREGIYPASKQEPVILFDDFTTASQWVDFPFKVKSSACKILIPKKDVNLKYVYYAMKSIRFNASQHMRYWISKYSKKEIRYPDSHKQALIVESLDKITNEIKNENRLLSTLDSLIKSRFIELFHIIDISTQNEEWSELETLSTIYTGTTPSTKKPENWNGDILWVTPAELNDDIFVVNNTERKITEKGRQSKSLSIMPIGTVLLSTRAPIGKVAITGAPMTCNQGFKNFYCNESIDNYYLYYLLKFNRDYLNEIGSGTTFKEVSRTKIGNVKIPVPSIDVQKEFKAFANLIDKLKFNCQQRIKLYQELLDKKMDEYFG